MLFVCLGNICRSPAADGWFRERTKQLGLEFEIDSAGTSAFHIGEPPHSTMVRTAQKFQCDLSFLRARQAIPEDFHKYDHILAMDTNNFRDLKEIQPKDGKAKLSRLLDHVDLKNKDVPDPYYGGPEGFERCFQIVRAGIEGWLENWKSGKL